MKKLAVSAMALVLACPAFAGQNQEPAFTVMGLDPYIGMRAGMGYNSLRYSFNGDKKSVEDMDFRGRLALGLEVCDTVRSEIEWSISIPTATAPACIALSILAKITLSSAWGLIILTVSAPTAAMSSNSSSSVMPTK